MVTVLVFPSHSTVNPRLSAANLTGTTVLPLIVVGATSIVRLTPFTVIVVDPRCIIVVILFNDKVMDLSLEEFYIHLEHIINLLSSYENYQVYINRSKIENQYMVYVKEELDVIIAKTSQPPIVLAISEGNMIASFWDYLKNIIGERAYDNYDNENTINELKDYLKKLK